MLEFEPNLLSSCLIYVPHLFQGPQTKSGFKTSATCCAPNVVLTYWILHAVEFPLLGK